MVRTRPIRRAIGTAASSDRADRMLVQKNTPATAATEMPKVWNSHSASSDWTSRPPEKASMLNSAASR